MHKPHNFLCGRFDFYHKWHHHPHHKKIHWAILSINILVVLSIVISSFYSPYPTMVQASSNTWNFNTPADYTYDSSLVAIASNDAQLKKTYTPSTNWIATDAGGYDWNYRRQITINNTTGSTLTNYQSKLALTSSNFSFASAKSDGSDVRLTDSGGVTALNYWIESYDNVGQTATIWVKSTLAAGDNNIFIYYGNSNATTSTQDGSQVFGFFDDFTGSTLNTTNWPTSQNVEVSGGNAVLNNYTLDQQAGSEDFIYSSGYEVTMPSIIEYRLYTTSIQCRIGITSQRTTFYLNSISYIGMQIHNDNNIYTDVNHNSTLTQNADSTWTGSTWYTMGLLWKSNSAKYIKNTTQLREYTSNVPDSGHNLHILIRDYCNIDWVRVRQYATTDPTITYAGEIANTYPKVITPGTNWIAADGGGHNWNYRKKISFNNTQVNIGVPTENLADFPVMVKLTTSNTDYSKFQSSGQDLRFTDSNGTTALKYEIELWNASGDSYIWVKVPQIDAGSNYDNIYLYYGNATITDGQDKNNTWNSSYKAVWHLSESSGTLADSTSNARTATPSSLTLGSTGKIGKAITSASSSYASYSNTNLPSGSSNKTMEVWMKRTNTIDNYRSALMYGNRDYYQMMDVGVGDSYNSGKTYCSQYGAAVFGNTAPQNDWVHLTVTAEGTSYKSYENGLLVNSGTMTTNVSLSSGTGYIARSGTDSSTNFIGLIDEPRITNTAETAAWIAANYKSQVDSFNTLGSEYSITTANPIITPNTAKPYTVLSSFTNSLGSGSAGDIKYQVSNNSGTTWYWWNGSAWTATTSAYAESNTATDVNTNITTLAAGSNSFKWQAFFNSDGTQLPKLTSVTLGYYYDSVAPPNPTLSTHLSAIDGSNIDDSTWYPYSSPYFTWSTPTDTANTGAGESASGIAGYYLYFGTNASADPSSWQTAETYTGSGMSYNNTYYLRIKTKDNAGNISSAATIFTYKYDQDNLAPPAISSVTAKSAADGTTIITDTWYNYAGPYFSWDASVDATDESHGHYVSGTAGYYVYFGTSASGDPTNWQTGINYTAGSLTYNNTYYLRIKTKDNTGNVGSASTLFTYKYDQDNLAPPNPSSITALSAEGGTAISEGTSYGYQTPYFSWDASVDATDVDHGHTVTGTAGYYISFTTNDSEDPTNYQTDLNYTAGSLTSGNVYYFRLKTKDNANNVSSAVTLFTYTYNQDTIAPTNPTLGSHLSASGGTTISEGTWYNHAAPYFTWSGATDSANTENGEEVSNVSGYYVYFGTSASGDPANWQTDTAYTAGSLTYNNTYYLRIKTKDNAGNISSATTLFTYKYDQDNLAAPNPSSITALSAEGGTAINEGASYGYSSPYFSWDASVDATDETHGHTVTGIAGYYVYFGTSASGDPTSYQTGTNYTAGSLTSGNVYYFRLKTKDNANNVSSTTTLFTYTYSQDTIAPSDLTLTAHLSASGGTSIDSESWYNHSAPYFTWNAPTDTANTENGETVSGIAGYYVYFGIDDSANPVTAGAYQTATTYTASSLTSGLTYYLITKTKDNAGNISDQTEQFIYKYDNVAPTNPGFVSVSPTGYSNTNSYIFLWPSSGANAASDTGAPTTGSGVAGYQYKTGATSGDFSDWSETIEDTSADLDDSAYQEGANTFYLRVIDNAGNTSNYISTTFYYSGSAPAEPRNLTATPSTTLLIPSFTNAFSFAWQAPESAIAIGKYYYTVNIKPTATNSQTTTITSLPESNYATQQGKNTLYVVAEDSAENANFDLYASVDFYVVTPAPGAPTSLESFDISNRDDQEYAVTLKWTAPANLGAGFSGYEIFRSVDNTAFESIGTSQSTSYIDTDLESIQYYYYIVATDNAGQNSDQSDIINITPTGRFTNPPTLVEDPAATAKSFSATITWRTDRESSSFIEFGLSTDTIGKEQGGKTIGQLEQEERHSIQLDGLEPETIYYYQAVWVDEDGNEGRSETQLFQTGLRPKISNVTVSNITLSSATISWETTTVATSVINYGKTTTYGGQVRDQSGSQTTQHTINISGLEDSSTYFFQITGIDTDSNTLSSDSYSFNTLIKPVISALVSQPVSDASTTTIKFSWSSNIPTTSIINYWANSGNILSQSNSDYKTNHEIIISGLADRSVYFVQAKGVDQYGNEAQSEINSFSTPQDTRPPKIFNLSVEVKSNGMSASQKPQIAVSWETDEPSTAQVEYGPGISADSYPSKSQEDSALSTNHVVIISELEAAKIYHLRTVSADESGNTAKSVDTTAITGEASQSVIDIIINSLERSLGFLLKGLNFLNIKQ